MNEKNKTLLIIFSVVIVAALVIVIASGGITGKVSYDASVVPAGYCNGTPHVNSCVVYNFDQCDIEGCVWMPIEFYCQHNETFDDCYQINLLSNLGDPALIPICEKTPSCFWNYTEGYCYGELHYPACNLYNLTECTAFEVFDLCYLGEDISPPPGYCYDAPVNCSILTSWGIDKCNETDGCFWVEETPPENCTNLIDDDNDDLVDCDDPDCSAEPHCQEGELEIEKECYIDGENNNILECLITVINSNGNLSDVVVRDYLVIPSLEDNPVTTSVFADNGECISILKDSDLMTADPPEEPANVICYLGDMENEDYSNIRIRWVFAQPVPIPSPQCEFYNLIIVGSDLDEEYIETVWPIFCGEEMPTCVDNDNDGFGEFGDLSCLNQGIDCDDETSDDIYGDTQTCPTDPLFCSDPLASRCAICINPLAPENCDDGVDNDCNDLIDIQDPQCEPLICDDFDSDEYDACDGFGNPVLGCDDPCDCDDVLISCGANCNPGILTETNCTDTYDNDCDGTIDCADIDCDQDQACQGGDLGSCCYQGGCDNDTLQTNCQGIWNSNNNCSVDCLGACCYYDNSVGPPYTYTCDDTSYNFCYNTIASNPPNIVDSFTYGIQCNDLTEGPCASEEPTGVCCSYYAPWGSWMPTISGSQYYYYSGYSICLAESVTSDECYNDPYYGTDWYEGGNCGDCYI